MALPPYAVGYRYQPTSNNSAVAAAEHKLDLAFMLLSQRGVIARQHAPCCRSCAIEACSAKAIEDAKMGVVYAGCVFYSDGWGFRKHDEMFGAMCLEYSPLEDDAGVRVSTTGAEALGAMVCDALREVGLRFEWNGRARSAILVHATE